KKTVFNDKRSLVETSDILLNAEGEVLSPLALGYPWNRIEPVAVVDPEHSEDGKIHSCANAECPTDLKRIEILERVPCISCLSEHHTENSSLVIQHQWVAKL